MLYYFILGQSPALSLAEICAYLGRTGFDFTVQNFSEQVIVLETKKELAAESVLDDLGGTIKIGEIAKETSTTNLTPKLIAELLLSSRDSLAETKFHFGFSVYNLVKYNFRLPRNFGLEVKNLLKEKNIASRLVTSNEPNLSSVTVAKNRLLKNGAEICLLVDKDKIYLGKTLAVQKFGEYSKLDYGRPGRDSLSGMLPPKVAKMMVNIAQLKNHSQRSKKSSGLRTSPALPVGKDSVLLDPFCGSGTVLQETALLGYNNLIGSDISAKAIEDTKKNWAFLADSRQLIAHSNLELHVLDATKLSSVVKPNSVDVIVTEPFLGPPLRGSESPKVIKETIDQLSSLYFKSFNEFKKILKPNGKVVIIFAILKGRESMSFEQLEQLEALGFSPDWQLPKELDVILTDRQSIIYSREGQKVEREIFCLKLK